MASNLNPNEELLKSEGHNLIPQEHRMRLTTPYKHPSNAQIINKPVVDVSTPFNPLDPGHQARGYGSMVAGWGHTNLLSHIVPTKDEVEGCDSYTSWDTCKWYYTIMVAQFLGNTLSKTQTGNHPYHARTLWAHRAVFWASMARLNLAWAVGVVPYWYTYEFLYTYVPGFKIDDPSVTGWKRGYYENQSTYRARIGAAVWVPVGVYAWKRSPRSLSLSFVSASLVGMWYDSVRYYATPGMTNFFQFLAAKDCDRQARYGSLMPNMYHRIDADSNRAELAGQFRYFRLTSGQLQQDQWDNASHDYLPCWRPALKIPNPYYNWQKAPQTYEEKRFVVKNDLWQLPSVINGRMLSGVMDA